MGLPRLLIIIGSSGVGKSTMSAKIAAAMEFSKVAATDTIREVLRMQFGPMEEPALHRSSFEPAGGSPVEDWEETVRVLSEGIQVVIRRAQEKRRDLLIEGVHYVPEREAMESWRDSGGSACGVLLHVSSEERHSEMIANREKHNGKNVEHYLGNFIRIRAIQDEMIARAKSSGWLVLDPTEEEGAIELISGEMIGSEATLDY
ncbi:MAG TPA: hypothetical protein QF529_04275 [Candidatus Thalassarchaeaceae archaeon]|jgi:2-phosphoglycerate kinase|nr:hypothetical protein [Candidatus Thalassarchaeaceae archaeon]|tara:strand:+ start:34770 stop:35378 length:609 start_codon:yes stop_codon:yes gene_type:complete